MANAQHIDLLKQGHAVWNQWRQENPTVKPALDNANFYAADLFRVDLNGVTFQNANFSGANLVNANLCGVHFVNCTLTDADFGHCYLNGARLEATNLTGADLAGSVIVDTKFIESNLNSANLSEADLSETELNYTSLRRTDFSEAHFYKTRFFGLDLSVATGLEAATHLGPSTLDLQMLSRSKGQIPAAFLRGCGVSDEIMTLARELLVSPVESVNCTLVYREEESDFARKLYNYLQDRGIRCWLDPIQSSYTRSRRLESQRTLNDWNITLYCASGLSLNSGRGTMEFEKALREESRLWFHEKKRKNALLVVDLDGYIRHDWNYTHAKIIQSRIIAECIGWQTRVLHLDSQFEIIRQTLLSGAMVGQSLR